MTADRLSDNSDSHKHVHSAHAALSHEAYSRASNYQRMRHRKILAPVGDTIEITPILPKHSEPINQFISSARDNIISELTRQGLPGDDGSDMTRIMNRLEKRFSKHEMLNYYKQIELLLEDPKHRTNSHHKVRLAVDLLKVTDNPAMVKQGDHGTCWGAALEYRWLTRDPAAAAKLVAETLSYHRYKTADGSSVKVEALSILPDEEALNHTRDYASQVIQAMCCNIRWRAKGTVYHRDSNRDEFSASDSAINYRKLAPAIIEPYKGGTVSEITDVDQQVTRRFNTPVVLHHHRSPSELGQTLRALKSNDFPLIAAIDTNFPPFNKRSQSGHAICIDSVKGDMVTIQNWWSGSGRLDQKAEITLEQLNAMLIPD